MTLNTNTFESGQTSGTAITTGNSGVGGVAFSSVTGGGQTFATAAANKGSLGYSLVSAASTSTYIEWASVSGATNTGAAVRFYLNIQSASRTNSHPLCQFRSGGGGTGLLQLQLNTVGNLLITSDAAGGTTLGTTTGALSNTTWYRVEMSMSDPTNTTGTATLRVYAGDSLTSISNMDLTITGQNCGSGTTIGMTRIGRPAAIGTGFNAYFDDVAFQTGSTTLIGLPASNVAPTANAGVDKTGALSVPIAITGSDSDTDGTIASRLWTIVSHSGATPPTLTGTTTASLTATPNEVGTVTVLRYTVTDDGSLTAQDDMNLYVPSAVVTPISVTANAGSWTNVGGAADIKAAVTDSNDATYAQSPAVAAGATLTMRLAPLSTPSTFSLTVRHALSAAGANTSTVALKEGATVRKTWTVVPTTTLTDTVLSLDSSEIATVTSWNALDVEFSWTAS